MALVIADRVWETSAATGTAAFQLAGAKQGFQAFSAVCANNDLVTYSANDGTNWEVGLGTWTTGNHLARTSPPFASSNGNALVNFSGAIVNVQLDILANYFKTPHARISREVTAPGTITVTVADDIIYVNKTVGQATPVLLPRTPNANLLPNQSYSCMIVDAKVDCGVNNITVTDPDGLLINGQPSVVMDTNGQSLSLSRFSSGWSITA